MALDAKGGDSKRIWVALPDGAWQIVEKLKGTEFGDCESKILEEIVHAYLREKGFLT